MSNNAQEKRFTPQQERVIKSRGKNLLVSASAGTGKTTVMIERIVSLIEEKALSVTEIAVVTFTIYASAQMKQRLLFELSKKGEGSGDAYFKRQCELVENAAISTIHSFCADILRNYFYVADIDPSFSIIDPSAQLDYADRVMTELFTARGKKQEENYLKLYRVINSRRGNGDLKKELWRLYEFSRCIPDFEQWYKESRKNYSFEQGSGYLEYLNAQYSAETNAFAEEIQKSSYKAFDMGAKELAEYLSYFASCFRVAPNTPFATKMKNLAQEERITNFAQPLKKYDASFRAEQDDFEKFIEQSVDLLKGAREMRNAWKKLGDIEELIKKTQSTLPLVDTLYELLADFSQRYYQYKKERSLLDFSDLEHLTLKVLQDEDAAAEIAGRYKALFVDEYQDVNGVQEEIINRLCANGQRGGQLFCVGDVKQSIYGFRQCDPSIFVKRQKDYINEGLGEVLELSDNFRSDNRILRCVNGLFNYYMSDAFGGVNYAATPPLESAKTLFSTDHPLKVFCYDKPQTKKEVKGFYDIIKEGDLLPQGEEDEEEEGEACQVEEAAAVVQCVKELVGKERDFEEEGRTVRRLVNYSDITVLSRDMREKARLIYRLLLANNIPVTASFEDRYSGKEIADLVNFLRVLDNPYCDIYFCGSCLSPLFNFTQNELAEIACDYGGNWQKRFEQYAADGKGKYCKKIKETLEFIEKYRALSMFFTVDALLSHLIEEKSYELYVLSMPNGGLRLGRLNTLLAEIKDKPHAASVSKFLQYFDGKRSGGESGGEQREGVFLTTIHKSKGLEFPIVISAGLGAAFQSDKSKVHFNKELGIALDCYDFENMEREESLSVLAQKTANKKKQTEEELRLLYVLTTRAKNSLTLIVPNEKPKTLFPSQVKSISAWITMTQGLGRGITPLEIKKEKDYAPPLPIQDADGKKLQENLSFLYPFAKEQEIPLKVTASGLREEVLRGEGAEEEEAPREIEIRELFKEPLEAAPLGTAYHKVFEKLSLLATEQQVKEKIEELMQSGVISQENAKRLDAKKITDCLSNPRLLEIAKGKIYHEIPFMVKLPYNSLIKDKSGEETVLQGVIDMLCVKEESVDVIDFKFTSSPHLIKEHYSLQMKAYREAVKKVFGKEVKSYIVSVINNEVIEIE